MTRDTALELVAQLELVERRVRQATEMADPLSELSALLERTLAAVSELADRLFRTAHDLN